MTSFERQLVSRRRQLTKKAKSVRFEDYLDDAATGYVGGLRRKFKAEDQRSRMKKEVLECVICYQMSELFIDFSFLKCSFFIKGLLTSVLFEE